MPSVFISSERIGESHVADLIRMLRKVGFAVSHSPRNPLDGEDVRWPEWYESRCREEIEQTEVFVIAITPGWDCSTWMCHEAEEALRGRRNGRIGRMYYYNPAHILVQSENMAQQYLHERLPDNVASSVATLRGR